MRFPSTPRAQPWVNNTIQLKQLGPVVQSLISANLGSNFNAFKCNLKELTTKSASSAWGQRSLAFACPVAGYIDQAIHWHIWVFLRARFCQPFSSRFLFFLFRHIFSDNFLQFFLKHPMNKLWTNRICFLNFYIWTWKPPALPLIRKCIYGCIFSFRIMQCVGYSFVWTISKILGLQGKWFKLALTFFLNIFQ